MENFPFTIPPQRSTVKETTIMKSYKHLFRNNFYFRIALNIILLDTKQHMEQ